MTDKNMRGNPNPNPNPETQSSNPSTSTTPSTPSQQPPQPSLASRIQSSAAGLAKSAFQPSTDTASTLASSTSSKPAGPSSNPLHAARDLSTPSTATAHGGPSAAPQTFREPTQGGIALPALTEDEFQEHADNKLLQATTLAQTDQPLHSDLQTQTGPWKGKARQDPTQLQFETAWQREAPTQTQPSLDPTDGAAVIALLSDATFDPNFEDPTAVPDTELDIAAAPAPLSASEREALDSFRKGLGMVEESATPRLTHASLVPDIDTFLSQEGYGAGTATGTAPTILRDDVLMRLAGASDWVGVQERYHDEVWGFLQPVLEAAREEIEGKGEGIGENEDGPAVRRLKMILMHMKG
ncbi:hypothetical protein N7457_006283 [Penicillium paradoxum]|uniref:uncharacterized protein n=1 Tax=Penicillium paradoxum TaxID=176176 RepID=UPI002546873B|nr:uncharacterized protein N7457_006283 [Penicillium paradoxum]KAJ5781123.1 hypothetical protein N7457_006283 [Penicillium paradoxum]